MHPTQENDRGFDQLVAFAAVARAGSFRAASALLGRDASIVSRRLSDLERRLGVRLMVRTTRSVTLTEAGAFYFRRVQAALDELDMATREVGGFAATPQGILRISVPVTYGREVIAPLMPAFLASHPKIQIDAHFVDRTVDIVSEGFDMVVRVGPIRDSSLVARKIGGFRSFLTASPGYLARAPMPDDPEALHLHACLGYTNHPDWPEWILEKAGERVTVRPQGPLVANSSESIMVAALNGAGIALAPDWMAAPHLQSGALVNVLPGWRSIREVEVHAVLPPGALVPAKTRAFVDELVRALRH
jgi:DNA-binding transcriptional LysR family regulator